MKKLFLLSMVTLLISCQNEEKKDDTLVRSCLKDLYENTQELHRLVLLKSDSSPFDKAVQQRSDSILYLYQMILDYEEENISGDKMRTEAGRIVSFLEGQDSISSYIAVKNFLKKSELGRPESFEFFEAAYAVLKEAEMCVAMVGSSGCGFPSHWIDSTPAFTERPDSNTFEILISQDYDRITTYWNRPLFYTNIRYLGLYKSLTESIYGDDNPKKTRADDSKVNVRVLSSEYVDAEHCEPVSLSSLHVKGKKTEKDEVFWLKVSADIFESDTTGRHDNTERKRCFSKKGEVFYFRVF